MSAFRFRAQVALDLRRRELATAQANLANAERDRETARQGVARAAAAVADAQNAGAAHISNRHSANDLEWYRFWILRLDHERRAAASRLQSREADVVTASAACLRAKQRCESLERLREKALDAHHLAEAAAETKLIDELATRRFTSQRMVAGDLQVSGQKEHSFGH
jgi:flagellar export protein FliJ